MAATADDMKGLQSSLTQLLQSAATKADMKSMMSETMALIEAKFTKYDSALEELKAQMRTIQERLSKSRSGHNLMLRHQMAVARLQARRREPRHHMEETRISTMAWSLVGSLKAKRMWCMLSDSRTR